MVAITRPTNALPVRPALSNTPGNIPDLAALQTNEITLNIADKTFHIEFGGVLYSLPFDSLVVNNTLTSTSTEEALSAAQGKVLKDLFDGLAGLRGVDDIAARDALPVDDIDPLTIVHVADDGDGKWARYQNLGTAAAPVWQKISDEDALAAGLGATNLSYTASPTGGTVVNTSGADADIPLATEVNAGQLPPSGGVVGNLLFATATGYVSAAPNNAGSF